MVQQARWIAARGQRFPVFDRVFGLDGREALEIAEQNGVTRSGPAPAGAERLKRERQTVHSGVAEPPSPVVRVGSAAVRTQPHRTAERTPPREQVLGDRGTRAAPCDERDA